MLTLVVSGCAAHDDWSTERPVGEPIGALAPGFTEPGATPSPEATITPVPGSWDGVRPPDGYRVALLTPEYDDATAELAEGVRAWAETEGVSLKTVAVESPDDAIDGIVSAMDLQPDLIIATGPALVDALALVTASHLDQPFLVLGGQLPEPTINVTAAIWPGASSRGSEVADSSETHDRDAYTDERAIIAARAGVASVLHDLTGIVISLR